MILVAGATGFVGGHLVPRLLADGSRVRALVRRRSAGEALEREGVDLALGDVTEPTTLPAALRDITCVVHLVGLIKEPPGSTFESVVAEGTRNLVKAAVRAGVERFVYVSAVGARLDALSRYHRNKALAEAAVRGAPFDHVIIRPSIAYGPGDYLASLFTRLAVPIPGDGKNLVQPLFIDDLVEVLAGATTRSNVVNQTFEIGGPEAMSFTDMIRTISRVSGSRLPHPRLPMPFLEAQAWVFETLKRTLYALGFDPPLTKDHVLLLSEDNICDNTRVEHAFDLTLTRFEAGLERWFHPAPAAA